MKEASSMLGRKISLFAEPTAEEFHEIPEDIPSKLVFLDHNSQLNEPSVMWHLPQSLVKMLLNASKQKLNFKNAINYQKYRTFVGLNPRIHVIAKPLIIHHSSKKP
ncbi:unnamed protein product [Dovyalis caffra]|uniref:Uncharacterized protein n=1 Tax=Dovyalis caffra TaxID=77055 RepID=A0AAV1RDU7_9ROSI|nr:unnamed protein product [Dovyalis caffra]